MSETTHIPLPRFKSREAGRLAERAVVRGLSARETDRLDRLLRQDDGDRRAYGRLARLFRALEGDPPLASFQRDRVLEGVLASVTPEQAAPRRGWLGAPLAARLAPVLALAVLVVVSAAMFGLGKEQHESFQSRGGLGATAPDSAALLPFCIRGGGVVKTPLVQTRLTPDASCLLDDQLQLMLTHRTDYPYLLVFGQLAAPGKTDKLLWYYPVPPTGESGAAPAAAQDRPLGQAIHLDVNHHPGVVRVVAVFSREPLSAEVLFQWIGGLGRRGSAASLLAKLAGERDILVIQRWVEVKEARLP